VKPTGVTYASPADQQYGSSIRGALQTGRQRNQLGSCAPTVDWNASDGGGYCAGPHSLEVFVFGGSGDHPVTRNQVELTCQQVVRQLTGIPDPTVAGALAIQVHITDNNSDTAITTAQIPARSSLTCGVATYRHPQTRRQPDRTGPATHPLGLVGPLATGVSPVTAFHPLDDQGSYNCLN